MNRIATISLVSYDPVAGDAPDRLSKTLEKMGTHITQAAAQKADLVVFPEICSYLGASNAWVFEELDGPTVTAMAAAARTHSVYVVIPQAIMAGGKRRNSSILIDRAGQVVGVYHKNVPTHTELDLGIIPGTETPVFETDFGRVALTICFDINYWEVGHAISASCPELVVWSSMWTGVRMMSRWAIEFGFYMAGVFAGGGSFIDPAGRPICSVPRRTSDETGMAPLITAGLDLDIRVVHHDGNIQRVRSLFERHGPGAATVEHLGDECLLTLRSNLPHMSTDELIAEFGIESMRDYLARVRRDRQRALDGTYPTVPH